MSRRGKGEQEMRRREGHWSGLVAVTTVDRERALSSDPTLEE